MVIKTASQLLLESAEPFDKACMLVKVMEQKEEALKNALAALMEKYEVPLSDYYKELLA